MGTIIAGTKTVDADHSPCDGPNIPFNGSNFLVDPHKPVVDQFNDVPPPPAVAPTCSVRHVSELGHVEGSCPSKPSLGEHF